jgi:hypothetical protein
MKKWWLLVPVIVIILGLLVCSFINYWYIDGDGNDYIIYNVPVKEEVGHGPAPYVEFLSFEEMVSDIRFCRFTKAEKQQIVQFPRNKDNKIPICDLDTMYVPVFPEDTSCTINWFGEYYDCVGSDDYGRSFYRLMDYESWQKYLSGMEDEGKVAGSFVSKERNATISLRIDTSNKTYSRADYQIDNGDTTIYVFEYFDSFPGASTKVTLYGENNGQYFVVSIDINNTVCERLPLEYLKQFSVERYNGK